MFVYDDQGTSGDALLPAVRPNTVASRLVRLTRGYPLGRTLALPNSTEPGQAALRQADAGVVGLLGLGDTQCCLVCVYEDFDGVDGRVYEVWYSLNLRLTAWDCRRVSDIVVKVLD